MLEYAKNKIVNYPKKQASQPASTTSFNTKVPLFAEMFTPTTLLTGLVVMVVILVIIAIILFRRIKKGQKQNQQAKLRRKAMVRERSI